jgi:hypothetical protein
MTTEQSKEYGIIDDIIDRSRTYIQLRRFQTQPTPAFNAGVGCLL